MLRKYKITNPKPKWCNIKGCTQNVIRSLSVQEFQQSLTKNGLELKDERDTRIFACEKHAKILMKGRKKSLEIEKRRRGF